MLKLRLFTAGLVLLLAAAGVNADVTLHPLFSDHMVLQQGARIPVWGKAAPGETVSVAIGARKGSARAGEDGSWMVRRGWRRPCEMTVTGENNALTERRSWAKSGSVPGSQHGHVGQEFEQCRAGNRHYLISACFVPTKTADTPGNRRCPMALTTPETILNFSAAYFFGREPPAVERARRTDSHVVGRHALGSLDSLGTSKPLRRPSPSWNAGTTSSRSIPWRSSLQQAGRGLESGREQAKKDGDAAQPRAPLGPDHPHRPATLYNAMIAPLVPYAIKGAIWYQGESNASRAYQYRTIFPAMIEDWRTHWEQGDFPFLFVQLANFRERKPEPADSDWAELREAQTMTLALKNTGMAVIIDIGDAVDIHPKNKQVAGRCSRTGRWRRPTAGCHAFRTPYHPRGSAGARPFSGFAMPATVRSPGRRTQGLPSRAPIRNLFPTRSFRGTTASPWSDSVAEPVAVRYGWADNPECTLYNQAGLYLRRSARTSGRASRSNNK